MRACDVGLAARVIDPGACPALQAIEEAREPWGDQLPGDVGELWGWFIDQSQDTVMELLAFLASGSVNAVRHRDDGRSGRIAHADQLARSAGLDMTRWWTADEAFMARLNKAQIAGAVSEAASPEVAAPLAKLPKAEAVRRAAHAIEGRGWLPYPLRTEALEARGSADDVAQLDEGEALAA